MTDIHSTEVPLFTKDDMIMTDNGYYANVSIAHTPETDTGRADTGRADTGRADTGGGNKISDNYKNLGFPVLYLYTINDTCHKQVDNELMHDEITDNEIMSDELYNKLISLAELKPVLNKKYTRNNKKKIKNPKGKKTKRNKKL